jgi:hypothetical protein
MRFGAIGKIAAFFLGSASVLVALGLLGLAASGSIVEGRGGAYLLSAGSSAIATPCFALLFSVRLAKLLTLVLLVIFAITMLWAAFASTVTTASPAFQAAAVVFGMLVSFRVVLALRRQHSAIGT